MSPEHAPTPCIEAGCFNLVYGAKGGRCPQCELLERPATPARKARGSPRERGYDARWERRRRRHLAIEPTCRTCANGSLGREVDHVIPHRGAKWLFDLVGNLQTLCKHHHTKKTNAERITPIAALYPLDLPQPPHARPTRLICGPTQDVSGTHPSGLSVIYGDGGDLDLRNRQLRHCLNQVSNSPLWLAIGAPRTAERAFWAHVMDTGAELELQIDDVMDGGPSKWWDDFMIDQGAEESMENRGA